MKLKVLSGTMLMAAALAGCSKTPVCTAEDVTKKTAQVQAAVQEVLTKDPSKAQEILKKMQDLAVKYQGQTDMKDACKAFDEVLTSIKS
ncbi:hypothetical protein AB4Y96_16275 [Phyllobacterium sp. TAF24]|uniref:hypothetical protein n=1 Tax=Phyllobacterium sp. TAF24 TaxID=3233068 RepID=UPI003F967ACE